MKRIIPLLFLFVLALTSCKLRENLLLPPGLQPGEYITGNVITTPATYLIKSSNDDSYLLIDKAAIADSTIHMGDTVTLKQMPSLTQSDSVHIATDNTVTNAYRLSILRDGSYQTLTFGADYPNLTIYTDKKAAVSGTSFCLLLAVWLDGKAALTEDYATGRTGFHPLGTGTNQIVGGLSHSSTLTFTGNTGNHYAFMQGSQDYVSYYLPIVSDNTEITLTTPDSLQASALHQVQSVFPSFSLFSSVCGIQSSQALGDASHAPLMKLHNYTLSRLPMQWIVRTDSRVYAWEQGNETWQMYGNDLVAPCRINGDYMLITPLEEEDSFTLPLDASLRQVYAAGLWVDLRNVNLPGGSVSISFPMQTPAACTPYLNGNPYTINTAYKHIQLDFTQNGNLIKDLPDSAWIEAGFAVDAAHSNAKLINCYHDAAQYDLSYKTASTGYDATHYTVSDNTLYASFSRSGYYLWADANTAPTTLHIPVLTNTASLQTDKVYIYWSDNRKRAFDYLDLTYNPQTTDAHPWLNGAPFTVQNLHSYVTAYFETGGSVVTTVPNVFYMSYLADSNTYQHQILLDDRNGNNKGSFTTSGTADATHFNQSGSIINCYPLYGGRLILGSITNLDTALHNVSMYQNMSLDVDSFKVWMSAATPVPAGSVLHILKSAQMPDPSNILASQYQLSQTSPSYLMGVTVSAKYTRDFYSDYHPLIYIKRNSSRRTEYLFSTVHAASYRIYPYAQGTDADGWHYSVDNGYDVFSLVHNGNYATFADNNPHNSVSMTIGAALQDSTLSLYQAQFILPAYFKTNATPNGYHVMLENLTDLSTLPGAVAATRLRITSSTGTDANPSFLTGYTTTAYPLIYVPFPAGSTTSLVLHYRDNNGTDTVLTPVTAFDGNDWNEYVILGNCGITFVNNPGIFYWAPPAAGKGKSKRI